jgi:trans-aconitate 2-methyltransferase
MTEWNAAEYARVSQLQAAMAEEVLALLDLTGVARILDVGCGNGRITTEIAARIPGGTIVGVDSSAEMIAFATGRLPASIANARFEVADARCLPFTEVFDLVVSFNALHWIPDQHAPLNSICNAARHGGRAQLRLVPRGERKSLENVIEETRCAAPWNRYFQNFHDPYLHLTPEEYATLSERCGLIVRKVEVSDKVWDFGSRAAFEAFGKVTFIEWSRMIPEAERPKFVSDVLDRYQQVVATSPGQENTFKFYQMDIGLERD